jgi:flagellar motor switch protein FliM
VFEFLQRDLSKTLKNFLNCDTSVELNENKNIEFETATNAIQYPSMIGVIEVENSEDSNKALILFENQFIYTILDILLGGGDYNFKLKVHARPFTQIENGVLKDFIKIMLDSINHSFGKVSSLQFKFKRLETGPNSILIVNPKEYCKLLTMKINPLNREGGFVRLLMPYSTLSPYKTELSKVSLKSRDLKEREKWFQYFENTVNNSKLSLKVQHTEKIHSLKDLSNVAVGSTIILNRMNNENWDLVVNDFKVSNCKLGQINNRIAVEVLDQIDASKFLD